MKLPTSDKVASFGKKPHIKKGYYPAQLLNVEEFKNKDGELREGKFGRQLIFEFAIYKSDPESGAPIEPMKFVPNLKESPNETVDVIIPKFVYHQYKTKDGKGFQTAITPNSAITKILKALGWNFSADGVELEPLIGNWIEANIDDWEATDAEGTNYRASTIKDINKYEGPDPTDVRKAEKKIPKEIEKQVKHEAVGDGEKPSSSSGQTEKELRAKMDELKKLRDEELLTEDGYNQAIEQLETKIKELE